MLVVVGLNQLSTSTKFSFPRITRLHDRNWTSFVRAGLAELLASDVALAVIDIAKRGQGIGDKSEDRGENRATIDINR